MLVGSHRSSKSQSSLAKSKVRRAAFHRCMSAASPRDATSLRGVLRVLRKWGLVCSSAASLLARACALHLLCRDAGFLHDAGIMLLAGLVVRLALLLRLCVCVRALRACLAHSGCCCSSPPSVRRSSTKSTRRSIRRRRPLRSGSRSAPLSSCSAPKELRGPAQQSFKKLRKHKEQKKLAKQGELRTS